MKEEKNKTDRPLSEFQRYVRGEMTKRQENAFQRKLQRDPFAAEAAEGYSEISADEADKDLDRVSIRLRKRVTGRKRVIFYRIAASLAVLMIISSLFLFIDRNKTSVEISKDTVAPMKKEPVDDKKTEEPARQVTEIMAESQVQTTEKKSNATSIPVAAEPVSQEMLAIAEKQDTEELVAAGQIAMAEKDDSVLLITADLAAEPAAPVSDAILPENRAETKNARAVGGVAAKAAVMESAHTPPVPVAGKENFARYIQENIRIPEILSIGDSVFVNLMITVSSTGKIEKIRILSSPGNEFSNEAERLISGGPGWLPAKSNGRQIEDSLKLVIPFKK